MEWKLTKKEIGKLIRRLVNRTRGTPGAFLTPGFFVFLLIIAFPGCGNESDRRQDEPEYYESRVLPATGVETRFYMGRQIDDLPLFENSSVWLDRPARDTEELPLRLIRAMNLRSAMVVADVGAGTGYFTFQLANVVSSGRVMAIDVQPSMLDTIRVRMRREGVRNIQTILGTSRDPGLAANSIDRALIVASYHEFSHPREMIVNIAASLKDGGRLIIVEYRAEDATIPVPDLHRMSLEQIRQEIEAAGLVFRELKDILPQQHFVVFEKPVVQDSG